VIWSVSTPRPPRARGRRRGCSRCPKRCSRWQSSWASGTKRTLIWFSSNACENGHRGRDAVLYLWAGGREVLDLPWESQDAGHLERVAAAAREKRVVLAGGLGPRERRRGDQAGAPLGRGCVLGARNGARPPRPGRATRFRSRPRSRARWECGQQRVLSLTSIEKSFRLRQF